MKSYEIIIRLVLAVASGALIGYERGKHGRAAGLRTHMLVSLGAAMTAIVGTFLTTSYSMGDPSRISSSVVSGIGFIGAGIILLKGGNKITGLTTAAAMWATATVGLAYGAGEYVSAFTGTLLVFVILTVMSKLEKKQKKDYLFFIEIDDAYKTNEVFAEIKRLYPESHSSDVLPSKSGIEKHVGLTINITDETDAKGMPVIEKIRALPGVVFIVKQ